MSSINIAELRDELTQACHTNSDLQAENRALVEALEEAEEYFDQRADAEYFPDSPGPHPNEEMKLLCTVRAALLKAAKASE